MPSVHVTLGDPLGAGYGKIHAESMDVEAEAHVLVEEVEAHLTSVAEGVPSGCIDGRGCVSCMDGTPSEVRPKVAGGGLITSYAGAELVKWFNDDAGSSEERLAKVHAQLKAANITTGAHCDQSAAEAEFNNGKTGCGADDRLPEILQVLHENKEAVNSLTSGLLGDDFSESATLYTDTTLLAERHGDWSPTALINEVGGEETPHNVEILQSDQTETHGHKELAVVFNNIENTSVDRDGLLNDTGKQVFVVDVWYLRKLAAAMATGPDAVAQEKQLLHAMTAYQIATYLTLCDGSQRPIIVNAA